MRIRHPRPQLGRQKFIGVEFVDGVAEVTDLHIETVASLLQHGFTIEDEPLPAAESTVKVSKPRTKKQQKALDNLAKHIVPLTPEEEANPLTGAYAQADAELKRLGVDRTKD